MKMKKDIKILLIFPPLSDPMYPYLSLPSLAAFLRQNGYNVIQKDLNIETYNSLLTKPKLQIFYKKAYNIFKNLENKNRRTPEERFKYEKIAEALLFAPNVIENIEKAKMFLKDKKRFYDLKQYSWSAEIIHNALKLILRENYSFDTRLRVKSITQLMQAIRDEEINPFLEFFKEEVVPSILIEAPDLVGISITYQTQIVPGFTLASLIKEKMKNIHISIGGNIISHLFDRLLDNKELSSMVDTFIIKEGEHALLELIKRIENNKSLEGIPNLIFYNGNRFINNEDSFIENIDSLPVPDFDDLPLNLYFSPESVLPLLTSRGCYWGRCVFCNIHSVIGSKNCRLRNTSLIIEDIHNLSKKYNTKYFLFSDNAISPKVLKALSSLIIKNKMNIYWQCEARIEKEFNLDLCSLMAKAGCRNLTFGFESGSNRILKLMQKGTNLKTIKSVLKNCRLANITTNLQFFIGFPTETLEEANETLEFILKNKNIIDSVSFAGPFRLFKDTKIFESSVRYGISRIYEKARDSLDLRYKYEVKSGMDMQEVERIGRLFRKKINKFYPKDLMYPCPGFNAHRLLYSSYYFNGQ
jgi:radical SAM superfamily enzyme YgiQ (UPF0313 family)